MRWENKIVFYITQWGLILGIGFFISAGTLFALHAINNYGLYEYFTGFLMLWIFQLRQKAQEAE